MPVNRPLSPSLRSQAAGFQGQVDDSWTKLRPGTSPAACTSPGSESLRTARPWTVSLASVKSFTSGSLAADSWSELLSKGFENDGLGGLGPAIPEPLNPKTEIKSRSLVTKVAETCDEYRLRKREDDLRAFHGICSNMSFRRPRGMDILSDRARATRKPPEPLADGFVVRGPTGQTASEIATQTPLLQTLDSEHFTLITRLIEAEAMHFVSVIGGQLLFREKDPVENAYIVLSGSVQQYSEDHNFLRSMGWHPHEQTEEDEKLRLNRQASSRSQLGDVASAMDCLEDEEEVNPKDFLTLTEYVRKKGMPDLQQRFRTLEGHSTFCQDGSYGNLYNTATSGSLVGEPALKAEKLWRSTAMCLKDCEFLVIDGTIFQNVLKSVRETHRFFDLYLPGIQLPGNKAKTRPHPMEYWKREFLPVGETILEEGVEVLDPCVFMVQRGKLELRRYRRSSANPAYLLATQPLRGRRTRIVSKELPAALPEIARSFVEDLDEDGLPRLGLPPPLKGSVRQKLEGAYFADPKSFIPADVPTSTEGAKVYHHKVLLKERLESRAEQRRDRLRDKAVREAKLAMEAEEEDTRDSSPRKTFEQMEEIRVLMRYVQSIQAARRGSPDYIGEDLWSDRPSREWLSRDVSTGPISRPPSSQLISEPDTRNWDESQETCAVLKPGDLYCSLSFFPLCGVSEPFSVVSATPDCCVHFVRGVQEAKAIPKHILKEIRLELGKSLQKKLGNLIKSRDAGSIPAPVQKEVIAPETEAPSFFPGAPPPDSPDSDPDDAEVAVDATGTMGTMGTKGTEPWEASVSVSRSLKTNGRLKVSEPLVRPRSAESYLGGGADAALSEDLEADDPFGFGRATVPRGRRARGKAYRPSFLRWLIYGKTPPWERRSILPWRR